MKNKKILAVILLIITISTLIVPMFSLNTFAVEYEDYLGYWIFNESISFPSSDVDTVISGIEFVNKNGEYDQVVSKITISAGDGNRSMTFTYGTAGNSYIAYGELRNVWYSSRVINVVTCDSELAVFLDNYATRYDTSNSDDYNKGFNAGFNSGYNQGYLEGKDDGYTIGFGAGRIDGYDQGYEDGVSSTSTQIFGKNLLGDTLKAPIEGLKQFVLYESQNGFKVTLGNVVGMCISFSLLGAFLKFFAGG